MILATNSDRNRPDGKVTVRSIEASVEVSITTPHGATRHVMSPAYARRLGRVAFAAASGGRPAFFGDMGAQSYQSFLTVTFGSSNSWIIEARNPGYGFCAAEFATELGNAATAADAVAGAKAYADKLSEEAALEAAAKALG